MFANLAQFPAKAVWGSLIPLGVYPQVSSVATALMVAAVAILWTDICERESCSGS